MAGPLMMRGQTWALTGAAVQDASSHKSEHPQPGLVASRAVYLSSERGATAHRLEPGRVPPLDLQLVRGESARGRCNNNMNDATQFAAHHTAQGMLHHVHEAQDTVQHDATQFAA